MLEFLKILTILVLFSYKPVSYIKKRVVRFSFINLETLEKDSCHSIDGTCKPMKIVVSEIPCRIVQ